MKRDMDLIRALMFAREGGEEDSPAISKYSQKEIEYHKALIIEAGLAEGAVATGNFNEVMRADLDRLTWAGHDFIDSARDDTIWKKAKEKFMKPATSFTFDLLKEYLKAEIQARMGG